ncbi:MAG TPA: aminotransferase class V-fold PLP-dependent enzyme, partial [Corynebacterium sp.]|uniref:aminotransferase class V-fold PLP-dependent enzyme n=1 Tax=Corynebacterium sp. TaxID=1720 RepID=UPI00180BA703
GGQERGLRSGTPDVAAAAGMAAALRAATAAMEEERRAVAKLRDRLLAAVRELEGVVVHTSEPALPGHVHVSVSGAEGDSLIMLLDAAGISAATGSACAAGVNRASHVLEAMGVDVATSRGALRLTLGWDSSDADVDAVLSVLGDTVARARAAGMA